MLKKKLKETDVVITTQRMKDAEGQIYLRPVKTRQSAGRGLKETTSFYPVLLTPMFG